MITVTNIKHYFLDLKNPCWSFNGCRVFIAARCTLLDIFLVLIQIYKITTWRKAHVAVAALCNSERFGEIKYRSWWSKKHRRRRFSRGSVAPLTFFSFHSLTLTLSSRHVLWELRARVLIQMCKVYFDSVIGAESYGKRFDLRVSRAIMGYHRMTMDLERRSILSLPSDRWKLRAYARSSVQNIAISWEFSF